LYGYVLQTEYGATKENEEKIPWHYNTLEMKIYIRLFTRN